MEFNLTINNHLIRGRFIEISDPVDEVCIVFLHDGLGCVGSWKHFPQKICEQLNRNGVVYDRAGHGMSDSLKYIRPIHYLQKEAIETLPVLLKQLGIDKHILLGVSDGASIALIYESEFQSSEALISIAAHAYVEDKTRKGIREATREPALTILKNMLWNYHGQKTNRLIDDWQRIWLSEEFANWNILSSLSEISCPSLIVQGDRDEFASDNHCFQIARAIGENTRAKIFEDCGHFPNREKAILTIETIRKFIHEKTELLLRNK